MQSLLRVLLVSWAIAGMTRAQLSYHTVGAAVSENFDTLTSTGTTPYWSNVGTLRGWLFANATGGFVSSYTVTSGAASAQNALLSAGAAGSPDRAFGCQTPNTSAGLIRLGCQLRNSTWAPLNSFTLTYTGEQWRAVANDLADGFNFEYRLGTAAGESINTATGWVAVPSLNFNAPQTATTSTALDGNAATNRVTITFTVSGITWNPGQDLWLRWSDRANSSAAASDRRQIIAIDDVSFSATTNSTGPVPEIVAAFAAPPSDPQYGNFVAGPEGYFWGAVRAGGAYAAGGIVKVKPDGTDWQTVASFNQINGQYPSGTLLPDGAGNFYGATSLGGRYGAGTLFKLNPTTGQITTLHEFNSNLTGNQPYGELCNDGAGFLWGTTSVGGPNFSGVVFKYNLSTAEMTRVVDFTGASGANPGRYPYAGLTPDGLGYLWGTTSSGAAGSGTVFKVQLSTGILTTVQTFTGAFGAVLGNQSYGKLVADGAGFFWGTTRSGGTANMGTIFKINIASGALTTLVSFADNSAPKGRDPVSGLASDGDGNFWGTTNLGGSGSAGTVYKISASTGALTTIAQFPDTGAAPLGSYPLSGLALAAPGTMLGATAGASNGIGSIFKITTGTGALTTLVQFAANSGLRTASQVNGGLAADASGKLWGTTSIGGNFGMGIVYHFVPSTGVVTPVIHFSGNGATNKGGAPRDSLMDDGAGFLWGATSQGGTGGFGTLFKINPITQALTTVVNFTDNGATNKGSAPRGPLVSDGAGNLWGVTAEGGTGTLGTVFKVNRSTGVLATMVNFTGTSGAAPGANPAAGLLFDGAEFLWGTTAYGGPGDAGTIFKIDRTTGALTTVAGFTGTTGVLVGSTPAGQLARDAEGLLWGTTTNGGNGTNFGTIFKIDPASGTVTSVLSFSDNGTTNKGRNPQGQLMDDGGGSLLGTTTVGGGSFGTLFRINKSTGALTTLAHFTGSGPQASSGAYPGSNLYRDTDGSYYGVTTTQGPGGGGTIFRLRFGPTPLTLAASAVTFTTATLNGSVNPNNAGNASISFEYGTSATLAGAATVPAGTVGNGSTPVNLALPLTGLAPDTPYFFRIVASNAGSPAPQAGIILSFTTPNPTALEAWKFTNLGDYAAPDLGDPDADGLPNLLEYAFGYLPRAPNPGGSPVVGTDGAQLTLTYSKSKTTTDITILAEVSSDLVNWTSAPVEVQQFWQLIDGDTTQRVTARDLTVSPPGAKRFMRVRAAR